MKITLPFLLFIVTLLPLTMFSQDQNLVKLERIRPNDVRMAGFKLETAQKIKIEAVHDLWSVHGQNHSLIFLFHKQ